jgi:hypothetical protein
MTLDDLASFAAAEQMISDAPVHALRSVEIHAPIEKVWHTLTVVSEWETRYSYLRKARLDGPFKAGSKLTYGGLFKHNLRLAKVTAPNLVMLYGTLMGYTAVTRWDIEELSATRVQVSFEESSSGLLIGKLYSEDSLGKHLQS